MSEVVALLLFSSISTTFALWLCLIVGSLTSWIAWGSFFVASVVAIWIYIILKQMKFETRKRNPWLEGF